MSRGEAVLARQLVVDGVANQLGRGREIELLENARAMATDGFDAQAQGLGCVTHGLPATTRPQDLKFTIRQKLAESLPSNSNSRKRRPSSRKNSTSMSPVWRRWKTLSCTRLRMSSARSAKAARNR